MRHELRYAIGVVAFGACLLASARTAHARLAATGPWDATHRRLTALVPDADPNAWTVVHATIEPAAIKRLEKQLGFPLSAGEDHPDFFVAQDRQGAFAGVVAFVDVAKLDVGVVVGAQGQILHVGAQADGTPVPDAIEAQLQGRNLSCGFTVGKGGLTAPKDAAAQSQQVASAAREALLWMKAGLGTDAVVPPCPV